MNSLNYWFDSLTEPSESDFQHLLLVACQTECYCIWQCDVKDIGPSIHLLHPSIQYLFPSPFTEAWYIESDSWCRNSRVTPDGGLTSSSRYVSPTMTRTAKQISAQSACIRTQLSHIIQEIWSVHQDCGATFKPLYSQSFQVYFEYRTSIFIQTT